MLVLLLALYHGDMALGIAFGLALSRDRGACEGLVAMPWDILEINIM